MDLNLYVTWVFIDGTQSTDKIFYLLFEEIDRTFCSNSILEVNMSLKLKLRGEWRFVDIHKQ